MPKFDLSKTQQVQDLITVELAQRDQAWIGRFYAAIVDASMATPPDQVLTGPDGFPYFVLNIPPASQAFEPFCISHILDVCLENGFGVVVQPGANPPAWVFPYGRLWSLKEFGKFEVEQDAQGESEKTDGTPDGTGAKTEGGNSVLVGQPSASFFPAYARKVIQRFLAEKAGNPDPGVLLLSNPQNEPPQSLVFSIFAEDFSSPEEFERVMYLLTWFLPVHYRMTSIPKDSELAKSFEPL